MTPNLTQITLTAARCVIAAVIIVESALLLFDPDRIRAFPHTGMPGFFRLALGWSELVAAMLFLFPRTLFAGGWALLVIFLFASTVHVLHGLLNVGSLVIDAMAVIVILSARKQSVPGSSGVTK